jgi:predicted PurR-regulated permease PerM
LDKKGIHRNISVVLVLAGVVILLGLIVLLGGSMIKEEFANFFDNFTVQLDNLQKQAEDLLSGNSILGQYSLNDIFERLMTYIEAGSFRISEFTSGWYSNLSDFVTILILIPVLLFFLLKDDYLFYDNAIKMIPENKRDRIERVLSNIDNILSIYFTSQLILAIILGIMTYIGYLLIGLPNALSLGLILMFMAVIPFIGPVFAAIPAVLIALTSGYEMVFKLFLVIGITQVIDGNLSRPNVMGTRLHIHPLIVIISVIIGMSLFGFIGAFFAIPFYTISREIVLEILEDKETKVEESQY